MVSQSVSDATKGENGRSIDNIRDETAQQPAKGQSPTGGDVSSQFPPVQYGFCVWVSTGDEGGEDDQNNRYAVVEELQQGDLFEDARRREIGQSAWPRWAASSGHACGL